MTKYLFRPVHRSFIIVLLTLGTILGVVACFCFDFWVFSSPVSLVLALILLVICFIRPKFIVLFLALISGIVIGSFRTNLQRGDYKYISQFIDSTIEVTGTIFEDPDSGDGTTSIRINNLVFGKQKPTSGSLYITLRGDHTLERSYSITVKGKLTAGFGSFAGSLYTPTVTKISKPDPPDLALKFRDNFASLVKKAIPEPEVDLSLGYLLGQRRALPPILMETLKVVGLTHIIVASGYNLSVLVGLSRKVFKKVSRFAALLFGLLLISCFISITGFTPSMSRAGLVSIISLFTWFFSRKFHPAKLLLLVASITLMLNPSYVQDLGWLLSFASFAGVMLVAPIITAYFYADKKPNFIAAIVLETVAAQLVCLPILLFYFGTFSITSLIANILILPTIPFVMLLTFITGITAFLPMSVLTGFIATKLLSYHIAVINFFGGLSWGLVIIPPNNPLTLLGYPIVISALAYMKRVTKYSFIQKNMIE